MEDQITGRFRGSLKYVYAFVSKDNRRWCARGELTLYFDTCYRVSTAVIDTVRYRIGFSDKTEHACAGHNGTPSSGS